MREMILPETGSKRKLLDAAEQLFAEKGFEAVSVRDITQLAKVNVAAVNYHFGSREALLGLVMMRYLLPVTEDRIARLEIIEKKRLADISLEETIEALVLPLMGEVTKSDLSQRLFHRLMGRIFSEQGTGLPSSIEPQIQLANDRFTRLFAALLPQLDPEELAWRIHFLVGGMLHILTHQDIISRLSKGASGSPSIQVTVKRFVDFAAAGMRAGEIRESVVIEKIPVPESPKIPEPLAPPEPISPQVMFDF
jgi:AcrR family transcriptional regulator